MASVSNDGNGRRRIQFFDSTGKRRAIRLGKVTARQADAVNVKIESLLAAKITGHAPDEEVSRWVSNLDEQLSHKLVDAGLIQARETIRLKAWCDRYIAARSDLKPKTVKNYEAVRDRLVKHFGADRDIRTITIDEAAKWREEMVASELSDASVRGFCRDAKTIFREAAERDLIRRSPFKRLVSASVASDHRYVSLGQTLTFLDRCESLAWRVLFGLARLAGLRVPSETHRLTWQSVNWDAKELSVYAPKNERFKGKATRITPLCPRLYEILREAYEATEDKTGSIVTSKANNRDREFKRQISAVGLTKWEALFQTLRSSCEIQWLMEGHPEFVVVQWIGHSVDVSRKHYANMIPKEDYELLRRNRSLTIDSTGTNETAQAAQNAAQNAAQQAPAEGGTQQQADIHGERENRLSDVNATLCEPSRMSALGLEPRTYGLKVRCSTN